MYRADAKLAAHAGVAVRHGDGGLLVAGGVKGDAAVSRHVIDEAEVPAANQPEGPLDPEPDQGLGYRFVYLYLWILLARLSAVCCGVRLGGPPFGPKLLRTAERHVRVELEGLVGWGEPEVGQPPREQLERDTGLQAGQRRAEAEVDAVAERYVLVRVLATDVERVRVLEDLFVAVGRE